MIVSTANPDIPPERVRVAFGKGEATPTSITKQASTYSKFVSDPIRPYAYAHGRGSAIDIFNVYTAQKIGTIPDVASGLGSRQLVISGDGLMMIALTDDPRLVFVPVGP